MESLIAALIGWIATDDEILNIQTGVRVVGTGDDTSRAEVTYPNGDVVEYEGAAADAIFERAENLALASAALNEQLNRLVSESQTPR